MYEARMLVNSFSKTTAYFYFGFLYEVLILEVSFVRRGTLISKWAGEYTVVIALRQQYLHEATD